MTITRETPIQGDLREIIDRYHGGDVEAFYKAEAHAATTIGLDVLRDGHPKDAERLFNNAFELMPDSTDSRLYFGFGYSLYRQGKRLSEVADYARQAYRYAADQDARDHASRLMGLIRHGPKRVPTP